MLGRHFEAAFETVIESHLHPLYTIYWIGECLNYVGRKDPTVSTTARGGR